MLYSLEHVTKTPIDQRDCKQQHCYKQKPVSCTFVLNTKDEFIGENEEADNNTDSENHFISP